MSAPDVIVKLVSALAWPVTVLICVLVLRPFLSRLVPLIRTLKYSDVEIQFGQEVAQLKIAAAQSTESVVVDATVRPIWEDLVRLAAVKPRTAIVRAWDKVEETLIRVAKDRKIEAARAVWQMPMVLGAVMLNKGEISTEKYELLSKLRQLVNAAEHAPIDTVNPDDAAEFVGLAMRMAASLDSMS